MANKAFEIQNSTLRIGGVDLQAGSNSIVIPGVTQATNYFVEEVDDIDGNNPDTFGSDPGAVTIIDNVEFLYRSGIETPSNFYSAAGYSVDELDDGEIDEINVEAVGTFLDSDRLLALRDNMWATTVADPYINFNINDWTQIPFKPKLRAGEVENVGGGIGSLTVGNGTSASFSNVTEILFEGNITEIEPGLVGISMAGGEGLPTVTIPPETGTTYKGLQVAYGAFHSNGQTSTRNVTKVVIHKPAITTTSITGDSNEDFFQVSGLATSDILAMFVVVGDINGEKPLSNIQAFAEAVIDNVILDNAVEGQYQSVDAMKAAFYDNYPSLSLAVGGLATNFQFYENYVPAVNGGVTTVREGSGAIFEIGDNGLGAYTASGIQSNGINYLPGHKILVLGTDLGGATPDNDCIVTIDSISEGGLIFQWSVSGLAAGTVSALYAPVTGTNYNVGSGFIANGIYANNSDIDVNNYGTNYVVGDVITLLGANITNGTTPDNNFTITVNNTGQAGEAYSYTGAGTPPAVWRFNSISDGGNDEYDTGNYINTSLAQQIDYNDGETVADGVLAFGTGSSYSFVYDESIFGLFVTGNSSTSIGTSGNGPDSGSVITSGNIYGPDTAEKTYDNAVTHINIIGNPFAGPIISFIHTDYGDEIDVLIEDDGEGVGIGITRAENGGIYNPYRETGWSDNISPDGTRWNIDGWSDFSNVESRIYKSLYSAFGSGGLGNKIVGTECVMYLPDNGKYYAVKFDQWTQNNNGGGFAYTRRELDLDKLQEGIIFKDGTVLKSAEGVGRVKLTAPGSRRIEEVYGYKQVSLTGLNTSATVTSTALNSNAGQTWQAYIAATGTELNTLLALQNSPNFYSIEVSVDQITWITGYIGGGNGTSYVQIVFINNGNLAVAQDDTVYYRILTGGDPVIWWDKAELPGGSNNFRGAVIDYHAYTGDSTIIGTIHIVDDDGEDHISHVEVQSGSTDGENDDLWHVTSEGQIKYRRIDGDSATLKVQWSAKVFYGSELWD